MSACVILTGSTGNLGSYLLAELARQDCVASVYCLNRSSDASTRQREMLATRGLELSHATWGKIRFQQCTFDGARFGLDDSTYNALRRDSTHIIHCAWPVDFKRSFESFQPMITGVANLISFAHGASNSPRLVFVSSVSAAGNWGAIPGAKFLVPEEEIDDWKVARMGYGQSKLVSERLLSNASRTHGITTCICRVGQVSGPVDHGIKGLWPKQEWLPSLVASSRTMRIVPEDLGPLDDVDWIPVDRLSSVIIELTFAQQRSGTSSFYNVVNPNTCPWASLLPAVVDGVGEKPDSAIRMVSFATWVEEVQRSVQDQWVNMDQNPAAKLEEFFSALREKALFLPWARAARFEVDSARRQSPTLDKLESVQLDWMTLWMRQWGF